MPPSKPPPVIRNIEVIGAGGRMEEKKGIYILTVRSVHGVYGVFA
jgi:hypothetical protein